MVDLVVVRGISGGGKSTLAKELARRYGYVHREADQYFVHNGHYYWRRERSEAARLWLQDEVRNFLKEGTRVVVAGVFPRPSRMAWLIKMAEKFDRSWMVLKVDGGFQNVHGLADDRVKIQAAAWKDFDDEIFVDPEYSNLEVLFAG